MSAQEQDKLSLKVMINKKKQKVVFAEADNHFADILLSFLTLPLGRILEVFDNHYGDRKAPQIGSLTNLHRSLTNLDSSHFVSNDARKRLLNPTTSSFEAEYDMMKHNICDPPSAQCPYCSEHSGARARGHSTAIAITCNKRCRRIMQQKYGLRPYGYGYAYGIVEASSEGVFTLPDTSFIISDDLQIFPNDKGVFGVITSLGITDMDEAEPVTLDFGFTEIVKLLKTSLTSSTPLTDVVLDKTNSESRPVTPLPPNIAEEKSVVSLKVMRQRSTGKFLSAQAKPDFIEFLCGLFSITLGGLEQLLPGTTCFKATKNLYRSTFQLMDCKYFKTANIRQRLMKLKLPHEFTSRKTTYLNGSRTYEVTDDLTIKRFCIVSILSRLKEQKIPISDIEEVELQIGLKKGLRIMVASLTSNSVISDALLSDEIKANKRVKREVKKEVIDIDDY